MTYPKTALEQAAALHSKAITSYELTQHVLATIKETDPQINAYISVDEEQALAQARKVDARIEKGDIRSPLAGVPIGLKDNLCLKGSKTTCASRMLASFTAPYTATAVQRVLDADLIPIGKCNMDEFAMGSSTENSAFFTTKNPRQLGCVPGGSSGGSAATVAAGQVAISLGSDTGGSIRQPAAFCGVVGVKPTYGRVSRYGLVAFASSLDQIGPFATTVRDAAAVLDIISGHDPHDATSLQTPVPDLRLTQDTQPLNGLKVAMPVELLSDAIQPGVKTRVLEAIAVLEAEGAQVDRVSMASFNAALASYYIIAPAEASANLARFDGVRYTYRNEAATHLKEMITQSRTDAFGEEVQRRILMGTFVLSSGYYDAYYTQALKARRLMAQEFDHVFESYDVVVSPTAPSTAFAFNSATDPLTMYANDCATIPANMAGLPALSVPCGEWEGLPVGLQLVGRALDEATLLQVADAYQRATAQVQ